MKRFRVTLPRDIVDHIRGFAEPERWFITDYKIVRIDYKSSDFDRFLKHVKEARQLPADVDRISFYFRSSEERNRFNTFMNDTFNLPYDQQTYLTRRITSIFRSTNHDHESWITVIPNRAGTPPDQFCHRMFYDNVENAYYVMRKTYSDHIMICYDTFEEFYDEFIFPIVKYKPGQKICTNCLDPCPRGLDECYSCVRTYGKRRRN